MKSWLIIECEHMDAPTIAKHLQVQGVFSGSKWKFEMPARLNASALAGHVQHWTNFLQKHGGGRRALQRLGYHFSLYFSSENDFPIAFTQNEIDLVARVHCGLVIENYDVAEQNAGGNRR